MKLNVSAPFHSELMHPASIQMEDVLSKISYHQMKIPVISNITAKPIPTAGMVKELLRSQITGAVKWEDSINFANAEGITELIEVGPGKVLTKLASQIAPEISAKNISTFEDIMNFTS